MSRLLSVLESNREKKLWYIVGIKVPVNLLREKGDPIKVPYDFAFLRGIWKSHEKEFIVLFSTAFESNSSSFRLGPLPTGKVIIKNVYEHWGLL